MFALSLFKNYQARSIVPKNSLRNGRYQSLVSLRSRGEILSIGRTFHGCTPSSRNTTLARSTQFFRTQGLPRYFRPQSFTLGLRSLRSTEVRSNANVYTAEKDESHPSLFYHIFEDDQNFGHMPVFALSFLESRPSSIRSPAVLGLLPANENSGLDTFIPNDAFVKLLHKTVKEGLIEDEIWVNHAVQTQSGWMHVFDQRNPPPLGRIPDADDILASVRVEEGQIIPETYEPMPSYRLVTSDGVCQLTESLLEKIKASLLEEKRS